MKEKYNWKSIVAGLIVLLIGICFILLDLFVTKTDTNLWISIGCSLIASALVIILTDVFVEKVKENPLEAWGIEQIYHSRSRMNDDCSISMNNAKYTVDVIAFGLKSFRTQQEKLTKRLLQQGVNFRIITMNPDSAFVNQREAEEKEQPGQIQNTIQQLITWADKLNKQSKKGKIVVKGYSCMTLDFYWRVDDDLYFGPYWYGYPSQQTVSYKYGKGKGFVLYTEYFDKLWNDNELLTTLTEKRQ